MRENRRWPLILLFLGLITRLIPSAFYAHPWDMYIWIKSGELGLHRINIYQFNNPVDYPWGFYAYPPTWLYWLIISTVIGDVIVNLNFKVFLIKLPIIAADAVAAVLLYRLARKLEFDEKKALIIMGIWLFNPITYFVSAFWGMFDSIAVVFMLLAVQYILDEKYVKAGLMIGVGTAVKILPALIILPALVYSMKQKKMSFLDFSLKLAAPAAAVFLVFSTPFLATPIQYFKALLQHTKSVGGFTYWMALSTIINLSNFWFIPFIAFGIMAIVIAKKLRPGKSGFIWASTLMIAAFLATSPKVNIQYVNFLIPLLLISREFWSKKRVKRNFALLMLAGILWIISSWLILAGYDLSYLGRLYVAESYEVSPAYILMILSGLFGGTRFIALVMDYLNLQKLDTAYISKWNLTVYAVVILIGLACILPSPAGVIMPKTRIIVGIPESADSSFVPRSEKSVDQFLKYYNVTHVVISFSPDFINTYAGYQPSRDITIYFKFKTQPDRWSQSDLLWLVQSLHARGVKVLLGIYLKAEEMSYQFGVQGFSADWVHSHPEIMGSQKVLLFNSTLKLSGKEVKYSEYFSEKIAKVIGDFDFDGVYLMAWDDWRLKGNRLRHISPLIGDLRNLINDKLIFIEGPDYLEDYDDTLNLLEKVDYVILKTAPWIRQIYLAVKSNSSLLNYQKDLSRVLSAIPEENKKKLLFSAYTFSFTDGWFNPAIELQIEVNRFYRLGLRSGYAIYYADRYVPYRITFRSNNAEKSPLEIFVS